MNLGVSREKDVSVLSCKPLLGHPVNSEVLGKLYLEDKKPFSGEIGKDRLLIASEPPRI